MRIWQGKTITKLIDKQVMLCHYGLLNESVFDKQAPDILIPYLVSNEQIQLGPCIRKESNVCLNCISHKYKLSLDKFENPKKDVDLPMSHLLMLIESEIGKVLQFSTKQQNILWSNFFPLPNCQKCFRTNKKAFKNTSVIIDSKTSSSEMGYRIENPINLFKKLKPFIGPMGIVNRLTPSNEYKCLLPVWHAQIMHRTRDEDYVFSAGKGISEAQSKMSALGEGIERYLSSFKGHHDLVIATFNELENDGAINPKKFGYPMIDHIPYIHEYKDHMPYEWIKGIDLCDEKEVYLPANLVFFPYYSDDPQKIFSVQTTTGLSGGSNIHEASLQGLFEVIERDAYWFVMRTNIELNDISETEVMPELAKNFQKNGLKIHLKDFTTDFKIPVVHALLENVYNRPPVFSRGIGCSLNKEIALTRAVAEAEQIRTDQKIYLNNAAFQGVDIENDPHYLWCFRKNRNLVKHLMNNQILISFPDIKNTPKILKPQKEVLDFVVKTLFEHGLRTYIVNLSHPEIDYTVVRVLVDGIGITDAYYLKNGLRINQLAKYFDLHDKKNPVMYKGKIFS